jgi:hypothetical protein
MKRLLAVTAVLVLIAAPAVAKGPVSAIIEGPGVTEPIVVEWSEDGALEHLVESIHFWPLAYGSTGPAVILDSAPTSDLGPPYTVTVVHMGPGGDAEVDVLVYPLADGGPLAYVEPDVDVVEMQAVTTGGWYPLNNDLAALLESHGVVLPTVEETKTPVEAKPEHEPAAPIEPTEAPIDGVSPVAWLALAGGVAAAGWWAIGRRPRRMRAS